MEQAEIIDIGATIYSDKDHGGLEYIMSAVYIIFCPPIAWVADLVVEEVK